ncbi:MAG TPA: AbrB/MazE/SpoVT family DNA-binding domain-containing protein [Thiotrichales bacterium]|nr:AbrB/MazE/SpoVT family DNA-binding domain-containing protein [Thiotrichales bacterium]
MLTKKTSRNQITLPKAVVERFPDATYFEVQAEEDRIILIPVRPRRADEVRAKLEKLGISEQDIDDAIEWARRK